MLQCGYYSDKRNLYFKLKSLKEEETHHKNRKSVIPVNHNSQLEPYTRDDPLRKQAVWKKLYLLETGPQSIDMTQ